MDESSSDEWSNEQTTSKEGPSFLMLGEEEPSGGQNRWVEARQAWDPCRRVWSGEYLLCKSVPFFRALWSWRWNLSDRGQRIQKIHRDPNRKDEKHDDSHLYQPAIIEGATVCVRRLCGLHTWTG
jgi:hypothetical protein